MHFCRALQTERNYAILGTIRLAEYRPKIRSDYDRLFYHTAAR